VFLKETQILTIFFSGCQSLPEENIVEPLYLISAENSVFYSVPSDFDDELVKTVCALYAPDFQQKNLDLLKKHIDKIYAGNSFSNNTFQIVVSGNFPVAYVNSSLKKNPKFTKSVINDEAFHKKYTIFTFEEYQICVISKNFILISQNVQDLIKNYEKQIYSEKNDEYKADYDSSYYEFFNDEEKALKIYMNSVKTLNDLIKDLGINLNLNFKNMIYTQNLYIIENQSENYSSNIQLILESPKVAKLFKTMFSVFMAMSDNNCEININENIVEINNFLISKDTILNFFIKK